jgi:hypothetical protein
VSGEPGIGKTELARAFARAAANDGALVLWGSAWEEGGAPPYWPWVQVLRSYGPAGRGGGARRRRSVRRRPCWRSSCLSSALPRSSPDPEMRPG